ncbi:MAG: hypothetical protein ACKOKC_09475 [Chthoniobacterales bacterium]
MTGPAQIPCEQLLLPFMVSRPRKLLPDLDRVRCCGGAPIEVKRAVFQSRRLHRKGKHLQAWNLLMALPDDFDDYRELINERLIIASFTNPLDRSQTCLWAKWIAQVEPDCPWSWQSLELEVYMQHGPLAALEVLYAAKERFADTLEEFRIDWDWLIAQRLCQLGRIAEAQDVVEQMVEDDPINRDFLLEYEEFYPLWPFLRTLPTATIAE